MIEFYNLFVNHNHPKQAEWSAWVYFRLAFFTRIQHQCIMHSKSKPNTSLNPKNSMADKTLYWETTWEIVWLWHSQFYCTAVIIHDSISVPHLRFLENSLGSLTKYSHSLLSKQWPAYRISLSIVWCSALIYK